MMPLFIHKVVAVVVVAVVVVVVVVIAVYFVFCVITDMKNQANYFWILFLPLDHFRKLHLPFQMYVNTNVDVNKLKIRLMITFN